MRARITVLGVVQGVGFRPFVAECARSLSIRGSVRNSGGVVKIEAFGTQKAMEEMIRRLRSCAPPAAQVERVIVEMTKETDFPEHVAERASEALGEDAAEAAAEVFPENPSEDFRIIESEAENGADLPLIPPDLPICEDCLAELKNPADRRFGYPFISCTACGPRYSILEAIPYDREHISMRDYAMCPACGREYRQPGGRRQHAQTISCKDCGPRLLFSGREGFRQAVAGETGGREAVRILKEGGILAVKGIGGYQLACRADREETVRRLRLLKGREKKPFAVMFPTLESIRDFCEVSGQEEALLLSPARPIVLLERKETALSSLFCPSLCAESRYLGAFLPYTGLHLLLTEEAGPLVMTSANVTDDPIITTEEELSALWERFPNLLTAAAWNTRRIVTPLDDSLMRVTAGHVQMLRRSRGFVPSPVYFARTEDAPLAGEAQLAKDAPQTGKGPLLAFGGDLKAVLCLAAGERAYLSQYLGDMENFRVYQSYQKELSRMERLFGIRPRLLACDLHPGYVTAQLAEKMAEENGLPLLRIQHHHAHAASVMAEHGLSRCIGVIFDGTGYGTDGHIWGGEFLVCEGASFRRAGHLEEIPLVGGDTSAKDGALTAACHLAALFEKRAEQDKGDADFKGEELRCAELIGADFGGVGEKILSRLEPVQKALSFGVNVCESSSMGRLFDAVSALLGIRSENSYEGECAVALENEAWEARKRQHEPKEGCAGALALPFPVREEEGMLIADRRALLTALLEVLAEEAAEAPSAQKLPASQELHATQKLPVPQKIQALALAFHEAVAEMVLEMCRRLREQTGIRQTALSGGVFANVLLQERCRTLLERDGFSVYVNEQVPGNDGGICLGQAWIAAQSGKCP